MRDFKKYIEYYFTVLIVILFTMGFLFHIISFTRPYVLAITDFTMLITNSIVLYFVLRSQENKALLFWCIITFILTYLTELAGVRTGAIFGDYHYGETMIFQILDVPVVIGMNWVILMLGSFSLVNIIRIKPVIIPFLSSLLIVVFDFVMEEIAIKLDYWQWDGNNIPLQNYIAWFIISLIFSGILALLKVKIENQIIRIYFIVQFGFFIGLRLFL